MYKIALKMLMGDFSKYLMLLSALTFSSLLMTQQSGVFCGLMRWTTATLRNSPSQIWVVDPKVEQLNDVKPMRDTDLARVRSVDGVLYAVPIYQAPQQARLEDGRFKTVFLFGIDPSSLIGMPRTMVQGRLEDLWQNNAVIVDEFAIEKLSLSKENPLKVGDIFEINDHEARIVGICKAERSFFGYPYVYTTYDRAVSFVPKTRKNLGFVMVEPQKNISKEALAKRIEKETGLKAYTDDEFFWATIVWYIKNTGIPISFGTTILLGFIVGIAVSGQTFYMFILENLKSLGALKAMGATNSLLRKMLILQAVTVGLLGYCIGLGITSIFGYVAMRNGQPPFYIPWQLLVVVLIFILFICMTAAFIGVRKVSKLEPAEVFRG